MIFCRIVAAVVVDRAVFDGDIPEDWPNREQWVANGEAQIGWAYVGGMFMEIHGFTEGGSIEVTVEGIRETVPNDPSNLRRQMIAEWEAVGNEVTPYVEQLPGEDDYRLAIQSLIDTQAQSRRYDSGNSLATYVTSTVSGWADEAVAFVCWRDAVWAYAYAEMDKVLDGLREQPTVEALIGELPVMVWPPSTE